jgi:hypothetical protein
MGAQSPVALERAYYNAVTGAGGTTSVGKPQPASTPQSTPRSSSSSYSPSGYSPAESRAVAVAAGVNPNRTTADAAQRMIQNYQSTNPRGAAVASSRAAFEASGKTLRAYMGNSGGIIPGYSLGGKVGGYAAGGFPSLGSDNIPAMLTPGEFVVRKKAVQKLRG